MPEIHRLSTYCPECGGAETIEKEGSWYRCTCGHASLHMPLLLNVHEIEGLRGA